MIRWDAVAIAFARLLKQTKFINLFQYSAIPRILHSQDTSRGEGDPTLFDGNSSAREIGTKQRASGVSIYFGISLEKLLKYLLISLFLFLFHRNDREVSVVYFRAGYEPGHYPSQNEWDARYLIEKSAAIKCPSIQYHLAGTKKVQQALAKPGILKRFLTDDSKIKAITNTFTGLYSMDSNTEDGQNALRMVLTDPAKWVLTNTYID